MIDMNRVIVVIDGLDGAGKSTLTSDLSMYLYEKYNEDITVKRTKELIVQHFPDYTSLNGHKIKRTLKNFPEELTSDFLHWFTDLFMKDRAVWWKVNNTDFRAFPKTVDTAFFLFDRYRMSNLFSNAYRFEKLGTSLEDACFMLLSREELEYCTPIETVNIFLTAKPEILKKRLAFKQKTSGIDANETEKAVELASKNFKRVIKWMDANKNLNFVPPYILIDEEDIRKKKVSPKDIWTKVIKKINKK